MRIHKRPLRITDIIHAMSKKRSIKTPMGRIDLYRDATPSSGVTVSVSKIEEVFKKLAKKGVYPSVLESETNGCSRFAAN